MGINASAHWSLIVLLIGLFGVLLWQGVGLILALRSLLLTGLLFLCVLCHEFGHAIAARTFGVRTLDVTLYPVGGIARLERMPAVPRQELIIAAAGPFVNLLLAAGFFLWSLANGYNPGFSVSAQSPIPVSLLWLNLALAGFNLLPVFPWTEVVWCGRFWQCACPIEWQHALPFGQHKFLPLVSLSSRFFRCPFFVNSTRCCFLSLSSFFSLQDRKGTNPLKPPFRIHRPRLKRTRFFFSIECAFHYSLRGCFFPALAYARPRKAAGMCRFSDSGLWMEASWRQFWTRTQTVRSHTHWTPSLCCMSLICPTLRRLLSLPGCRISRTRPHHFRCRGPGICNYRRRSPHGRRRLSGVTSRASLRATFPGTVLSCFCL